MCRRTGRVAKEFDEGVRHRRSAVPIQLYDHLDTAFGTLPCVAIPIQKTEYDFKLLYLKCKEC